LDVAKVAGVSSVRVSRVLNTPSSVKSETGGCVDKAIRELGYFPTGAVRAPSSKTSRFVAAIIPTIENSVFDTGIQALQIHL